MSRNIAVLITCYNRREKTIRCLHSLFAATLPANHLLTIFLVDDGSTDGTAAAVTKEFPEVRILQGNGQLYWNRGMHLAWETAKNTADFDFYLWLNDDVKIKPNGIEVLFQNYKNYPNGIIAGVMASEIDGKITYGGFDKNEKQILFDALRQELLLSAKDNWLALSRLPDHQLWQSNPQGSKSPKTVLPDL